MTASADLTRCKATQPWVDHIKTWADFFVFADVERDTAYLDPRIGGRDVFCMHSSSQIRISKLRVFRQRQP
jgi:hypothetical protein